jgi:hypothetical protein
MGACNSAPYEPHVRTDTDEAWAFMRNLVKTVKAITPDKPDAHIPFSIKLMIFEHMIFTKILVEKQRADDKEKLATDPTYKTTDMIREEFGKKYGNIQLVHTDTDEYMATNPEVLHYAVKDGDGNPIILDCPTAEEYIYIAHACDDYANTSEDILTKVVKLPKPVGDYIQYNWRASKGIIRAEITKNKNVSENFGLNNKANVYIVII